MKPRRLDSRAPGFDAELARLTRYEAAQDDAVEAAVRAIVAEVRGRGDAALLEYTRRFDRVDARSVAELEIPRGEMEAALGALPAGQAGALREAAARVRRFHERQLGESWQYREADGTLLGQRVNALGRVGLYVPGGKAAYPSSVLMNAIPARVAGVGELVMVSPTPGGERNATRARGRRARRRRPRVRAGRRAGRGRARLRYRERACRGQDRRARATPTSPPPSARCSARSAST